MTKGIFRFGRSASLALVDQGILSAYNLGLNLSLITLAGPVEFGRFVLASAVILVATSLQNALVAAPITMLQQGRGEAERAALLEVVVALDRMLRIVLAAAAVAVCALSDASFPYLAAAAAAVVTTMARETVRTNRFARGREASVLMLDAAGVAASIAATALLWSLLPPATASLAGLAVGNLLSQLALARREFPPGVPLREVLQRYRAYFADTRWSLAGVVTTELQQRLYVFALELLRGSAVLASVQAGRLLLGPLALATSALGRVARPAIARALVEGRTAAAASLLHISLLFSVGLAACYFAALFLAWPLLEELIFKGRYPGIGLMTAAWSAHAFLNVLTVTLSTMMVSAYRLRDLAYNTIISASVCTLLMSGLVADVPAIYAVGVVIAAEAIVLVLVLRQVRRLLRVAQAEPFFPAGAGNARPL